LTPDGNFHCVVPLESKRLKLRSLGKPTNINPSLAVTGFKNS